MVAKPRRRKVGKRTPVKKQQRGNDGDGPRTGREVTAVDLSGHTGDVGGAVGFCLTTDGFITVKLWNGF
jgi:hypothetical protein